MPPAGLGTISFAITLAAAQTATSQLSSVAGAVVTIATTGGITVVTPITTPISAQGAEVAPDAQTLTYARKDRHGVTSGGAINVKKRLTVGLDIDESVSVTIPPSGAHSGQLVIVVQYD
jgi:hypothetical protein